MITHIGENGCAWIESASTRDSTISCPDSTTRETVVLRDNLVDGVEETFFKRTVESILTSSEALYVEVEKSNGTFSNISILENAYPGSLKVHTEDIYRYVEYKPRVWVYDELPGNQGGKIKVPSPNNPQPGETRFLSRLEVATIVRQVLANKK